LRKVVRPFDHAPDIFDMPDERRALDDVVVEHPIVLLCHRLLRNAIFFKKIKRLATFSQKY